MQQVTLQYAAALSPTRLWEGNIINASAVPECARAYVPHCVKGVAR